MVSRILHLLKFFENILGRNNGKNKIIGRRKTERLINAEFDKTMVMEVHLICKFQYLLQDREQ